MEDHITRQELQKVNAGILEAIKSTREHIEKSIEKSQEEILATMNDYATDIESKMATKEDLKQYATKKDLQAMKLDFLDTVDRKDNAVRGDLTALIRRQALKPLSP